MIVEDYTIARYEKSFTENYQVIQMVFMTKMHDFFLLKINVKSLRFIEVIILSASLRI